MQFILQLMADLLIPEDAIKQNDLKDNTVNTQECNEVVVANEEIVESPNIFGLMEFH